MPSPFRLLIADDSASFRDAVSTILTSEGYEVVTAENGSEALKLLVEPLPDVIISDLHMPRMSGYELLAAVRQKFPNIPVIAMSSSFKREEGLPGIFADAFLYKGDFTIDQLCYKIIELIAASPLRPQSTEGKTASVWVSRDAAGYLSILCTSCQGRFKLAAVGLDGGRLSAKCPSCKAIVEFQIDHSRGGLLDGES
ncbi:MAG: response regulator [Acidobacteriia bacterium]|nr:response regulator [Terriglobia bacterium]